MADHDHDLEACVSPIGPYRVTFTKQYKSGNKLKWLQEYDELRSRGLEMRTAMKGAYEVVWKAVKAAAREKRDRRGVRGMFERQQRLQVVQAAQQALVEVVQGDEADGRPQNGGQERQPRGGRGAQRSLQEEWDTEEDGRGEDVVRSDEGGCTQMRLSGSCMGEGEAAGEVGGDTGVGSDGFSEDHLVEGGERRGDGDRGRIQEMIVAAEQRCEAPAETGKDEELKGRKRHRGRKGRRAQGKRQKGGAPSSGAEGSTCTGVASGGDGSNSAKIEREKKRKSGTPLGPSHGNEGLADLEEEGKGSESGGLGCRCGDRVA